MDLTEHEHPRELWKQAQRRWPAIKRGQPLAIGCGEQLTEFFASLGLSKRAARRVTKWWFGSLHYAQGCCRVGVVRVDLDGRPAGSVTPADAAFAVERLEQLKTHIASKALKKPAGEQKQNAVIMPQKKSAGRPTPVSATANGIAEGSIAHSKIPKAKTQEMRTNPVTGRLILGLNWKRVDTQSERIAVE